MGARTVGFLGRAPDERRVRPTTPPVSPEALLPLLGPDCFVLTIVVVRYLILYLLVCCRCAGIVRRLVPVEGLRFLFLACAWPIYRRKFLQEIDSSSIACVGAKK